MKIGILITSVGEFGEKGFYNSQEIGLAKELDILSDEVIVYKAVSANADWGRGKLEDSHNTTLIWIPVKSKGVNGIWDCSVMDNNLDVLIYFSDTQLAVPKVYRWCKKNQVKLYPYIGVVESHSTNQIRKFVMNRLFYRNIRIYRKCACLVKTPYIKEKLKRWKIHNLVLAPVGLDITLLRKDYMEYPVEILKKKWQYHPDEKILLFIGRMTKEKRPFEMIRLYRRIYEKDNRYRLLMVGKGELLGQLKKTVEDLGTLVRCIEQIPNQDIWELYRIADCFVNLNRQEIYGMAILEAMYYGCKVVAWKAPGPNFIIENNVSGCLIDDETQLMHAIEEICLDRYKIHLQITNSFLWSSVAEKIFYQLKKSE